MTISTRKSHSPALGSHQKRLNNEQVTLSIITFFISFHSATVSI